VAEPTRRSLEQLGAELEDDSLTPGGNARIAPTRFEDWLATR
jgi:hypothetical protein